MIIADYYHTFAKTNTGNNTGFLLNERHASEAQKQVKVLLIVKYTIRWGSTEVSQKNLTKQGYLMPMLTAKVVSVMSFKFPAKLTIGMVKEGGVETH
jgi:hypothetical protein